MTGDLLYSGKAKDLFLTDDENLIIAHYKDQATMLNGARKETIKGKGVLNNQISSFIFTNSSTSSVSLYLLTIISLKN